MLPVLANALVIAGACILVWALLPLRRLTGRLSSGIVRGKWYVLTALTLFFIAGYGGYALAFWSQHTDLSGLLVPGIFFLGAIFVRVTIGLALETVVDVQRISLLEQENITDPLTGIYNRRYLDRRLQEEVARTQRHNLPLSVALIDIDHFKRINDTYGHQNGDIVLTSLCKLIKQDIRSSDIAARYGGEEILIILTSTAVDDARVLAERLREHIASENLMLAGESGERLEVRISVSIGLAGFGQEINSKEMLIQRADDALYRAKRDGRNRVVAARQGAA